LLPTTQTQCAIPAGIFAKAQGAMLRGIAYGQELNLAHPPRPTDKRTPWEPEWAARIRVKSVSMLPLGEEGSMAGSRSGRTPPSEEEKPPTPTLPGLPDVGKALKGLFGR